MSKTTSKKSTKRQGRAGKIFAIIASVLLIAALGTSIAFNYLQYKKYITQGATGNPGVVEPPLDDDNVVVKPVDPEDPEDPEDPSDPNEPVEPVLRKLSMTPRAAVLAADNSAVNVPITVTPDVALTDIKIDWVISFKNAESTWANDKTVTAYATIIPDQDGAFTANLSVKQAFGEQIIVTASVRGDSDISATSTVDYVKKYTLNPIKQSSDGEMSPSVTTTVNESVGTISEDYTVVASMQVSNNGKLFINKLAELLSASGVTCNAETAFANIETGAVNATNSVPQFAGAFGVYTISDMASTTFEGFDTSRTLETKTLELLGVTVDESNMIAIRKAFKKTCEQMSFCNSVPDYKGVYGIMDFMTVTFTLDSEHSSSTVTLSFTAILGTQPLVENLEINPPSIIV